MRTTSDTAVLRKPFSSTEIPIAAISRSRWPVGGRAVASLVGAAVAPADTLLNELAAHDHARAAAGDHRDIALPRLLGGRLGRLQIGAGDDRAQHDAPPGHRPRRTETAGKSASRRAPTAGA